MFSSSCLGSIEHEVMSSQRLEHFAPKIRLTTYEFMPIKKEFTPRVSLLPQLCRISARPREGFVEKYKIQRQTQIVDPLDHETNSSFDLLRT